MFWGERDINQIQLIWRFRTAVEDLGATITVNLNLFPTLRDD